MLFIHDESATKQTALHRRNPKGGKGLRVTLKPQSSKFIPSSINGLIGGLRKQILTARLAGLPPRAASPAFAALNQYHFPIPRSGSAPQV